MTTAMTTAMTTEPQPDLTLAAVKRSLDANELAYGELALQNGAVLLVLERGGRLLGPFLTAESPPLLWLHAAFAERAQLRNFLTAGEWNAGGERIWVAPEIQFSVGDRNDFWNTIRLPSAMDPGDWRLDEQPRGWRLRQGLTLTARNLAHGEKELWIERYVHPAADPLAHTRDHARLLADVTYTGWEQVVTLREARHDDIMSEAWNVVQVWPGGCIVIPCSPAAEISDYFEPLDAQHLLRSEHQVALQITGDRRYKVGVKAAHTFGRLGYFRRHSDGSACLIVRSFFNNPSSPYVEEPPQTPGGMGDSIHIYNDGGFLGGYGELECHGQTIGGHTGRSSSTDQQVLWLYSGPAANVAAIGWRLLGMELAKETPL